MRSGLFPILEIRDGGPPQLGIRPDLSREALESYFRLQGRFGKSDLDLDVVYESVLRNWRRIERQSSTGDET